MESMFIVAGGTNKNMKLNSNMCFAVGFILMGWGIMFSDWGTDFNTNLQFSQLQLLLGTAFIGLGACVEEKK